MASAPKKVTITRVINNRTGVTSSSRTTVQGNNTTVSHTTTIGTAKVVSKPKTATPAKKPASAPAKAAGVAAEAPEWITGPNDGGWTMCGPVAVANHLFLATGVEASNADIERLYRAAGAINDTGAPLAFFLAAAKHAGLAGCRLASYRRAERPEDAGVLLLAVDGLTDLHAATVIPGGQVVMWGAAVDLAGLDAHIEDAWSLTWHDTEGTECRSYT